MLPGVNLSVVRKRFIKRWQDAGASDALIDDWAWDFDSSVAHLTDNDAGGSWAHQSPYAMQNNNQPCPGIHVAAPAIDDYLARQHIHCLEMDWLHADVTTYSEVSSTLRAFGINDASKSAWHLLLKSTWSLALWLAWILISVALYMLHPLWLLAWTCITAARIYPKWVASSRKRELMQSMLDTYDSLDNIVPSWRNTYALMERSRDLGAKWPTPLYRLVEKNMKGQS